MAKLKIISGPRTGAETAAMSAAIATGTEYIGYYPSEDKRLPDIPLVEVEGDLFDAAKHRVEQADGTLLFVFKKFIKDPSPDNPESSHCIGYSGYMEGYTKEAGKPVFYFILDEPNKEDLLAWLNSHHITTVNISGFLEHSDTRGIFAATYDFLVTFLQEIKENVPEQKTYPTDEKTLSAKNSF